MFFCGAGGNIVFLGAIFVRMGSRDGRMVLKSSPMQNFFAAATLHKYVLNIFLKFCKKIVPRMKQTIPAFRNYIDSFRTGGRRVAIACVAVEVREARKVSA